MSAELVVLNGKIHTMDPTRPAVEGLAAAGGRITATGQTAAIRAEIGPGTEVIDLRGRAAIPGLTDAHVHLVAYGLSLQQIDLAGARSQQEALERVRAQAEASPPGEWLRGRGWDRNLWSPPDFPDCQALDQVSAGHPVALSAKDGHALWLNTLALQNLGIEGAAAERWGSLVQRDAQTGQATGILLEDAAGDALERIGTPGPEALRQAILAAASVALRLGVTGVHDCEGGEELAAFTELWREHALPIRVYMLIPRENLDGAVRLGLQAGLGDDWLRLGHLKLFADGSLGSRTADMLAPYLGDSANCGVEVMDRASLRNAVEQASRAHIPVATHAIGDRANRRVLDVYAETRRLWAAASLRPRIEHVQLLAAPDLERLAQVGVIASMQPIHATSDWEMAESYWGERSVGAYAWRSLLRAGTNLAFGSDCPVETLDPLAGIHAAVTRQRPDGTPKGGWRSGEALTTYEAVRAYTWGSAYAANEEDRKGSLTPGKVADLVVLSDDIFRLAPEALAQVSVLATVCGGRLVYTGGL